MTAPTTALDRVQRHVRQRLIDASLIGVEPSQMLATEARPVFTLADLAEVTRLASEGIR